MKKILFVILISTLLITTLFAYSGGSGTSNDPYQIANLTDLKELSTTSGDWDKYFMQTADINASATSGWNVGNHDDDTGTPDSAMGFLPIGNGYDPNYFSGSYYGNGHTIDSLYINRPSTDQIGLFGFTHGSNIKDLSVTNVDITGEDDVGGLVGFNWSATITNSYSTGSVNIGGGLVGLNYNSLIENSYSTVSVNGGGGGLVGVNYNSLIENSHSTGSVSGGGGGLVGANFELSKVTNSYSTGSVSGGGGGLVGVNYNSLIENSYSTGSVSGDDYVGGLVGENYHYTIISNSYSTGSVSGDDNVGGFVGSNHENSSEISNNYSTGDVTRSSGSSSHHTNFGGFCGENKDATIEKCYSTGDVFESPGTAWSSGDKGFVGIDCNNNGTFNDNFFDKDSSNQNTDAVGAATAKATTEMKDVATFTDIIASAGLNSAWDFATNPNDDSNNNDYWDIDESDSINTGYPFLSWQNGADANNILPVITGLQDTVSFKNDTTSTLDIWNIVSDTQTTDSLLNYTFTSSNDSVVANYTDSTGILTLSSDVSYFGISQLTIEVADGFGTTTDFVIVNVTRSQADANNILPVITGLQDTVSFKNDTTSTLDIWNIVSDTQTTDSLLNYTFTSSNDSVVANYTDSTGILTLSSDVSYFGISQLTIEVADGFGTTTDFVIVNVTRSQVGVIDNAIPKEFSLSQNYPNPFNPTTTIEFAIPKLSNVNLTIYNILGQKIRTIHMNYKQAGYYKYIWNGENDFGATISTGIYFYRITAGKYSDIKKMIFMK